ncbi:MAG: RICIN domain-containing protein [Bacteroidota bacterium]
MRKFALFMACFALVFSAEAQRSSKRKAAASVSEGYYRVKTAASNKYMDVSGYGTAAGTKDTHVKLWDIDDGWDRVVQLTHAGDGYFFVSPAHCPHVWDIEGGAGAKQNGAKLQLWDNKKSSNQKFRFISAPGENTYYIKAKHSGKYIDAVDACISENGCTIQQWDYSGKIDQRWVLEPYNGEVDKLYSGAYHIKTAYSNKYWDIGGTGWSTNANSKQIQIWDLDDGLDRKIKFIPSGDGPYYYLEFQNGGRFADVQGGNKNKRARIVLYDRKQNDNQKFKIVPTAPDRFVFVAKHSNRAIDVAGGKIHDNGADLHQWDIHKGKSQQWKLIHADGPYKGKTFKHPEVKGPMPLSN